MEKTVSAALYFCLALTCVSLSMFELRYLAYLTPFVVLVVVVFRDGFAIEPWSKPFFIIVAAGVLGFPYLTDEGIKDLLFIVSGTSIALIGRYAKFKIDALLWSCVCASLVRFVFEGKGIGFSFIESTSPFESPLAFAYGLIALYSFYTRRYFLLFVSVLMCFVSFKRIALVALIAGVAGAWLLSVKKDGKLGVGRLSLVLVCNALACWLIVSYAVGDLDDILYELTGVSSNQLGMGRQSLLYQVSFMLSNNFLDFFLFGQGAGSAYGYVDAIGATGLRENLHSDLIKILFEYGVVVAVSFIVFLYRAARGAMAVSIVIYTNIVFFTDNILIYHFYLFFLSLVLCLARFDSHQVSART